jgi:hypothetical protein
VEDKAGRKIFQMKAKIMKQFFKMLLETLPPHLKGKMKMNYFFVNPFVLKDFRRPTTGT